MNCAGAGPQNYNGVSGGYGARPSNKKTGYVIAIVILAVMALPVLIPLGLCAGGGMLTLGLCIGGGLLAVWMCIGGGVLAAILCVGGALLTLAFCILGGLVCLAGILLGAVIGIGYGVIMMFQTPASGMAVTGLSLLILGCAILCTPLVWEFIQLCIKGMRRLTAWLGKKIRKRQNARKMNRTKEEALINYYPASMQKGADDEK